MSGKSAITRVVGVRVGNEVEEIIKRKASEIGVTSSDLLREVIEREFKVTKQVIDKRQLTLV